MKKILYLLLLIISFCIINTVYAASISETIELDKTLNLNSINYIHGVGSNYIIIEEDNNSLVTIYNENDEQLVQKQIPNLKKAKIIEYNERLLLVGLAGNALRVIDIDSNLIINKQEETTILINANYDLNLFSYDNKIFIIQTKNNNLADTKVFEVDNELNITENSFSSYDSTYLKNILKNDYYLLLHNDEIIEEKTYHYNDSTYTLEKNLLVGNNDNQAILKILDNDNNEILLKEYDFDMFINIAVINKKILILAKKAETYQLVELSIDGEAIDQMPLTGNDLKMLKTGDKLLIVSVSEQTNIDVYKYLCDIEVEESVLGTIKVQNSSEPYKTVTIEAIPNSGYVLDSLTIIDSENNVIETVNNSFTMPNNNVVVMANYKQTVNNPETMDLILFFIIALIITFFIMNRSYKKYQWLKR